MKRLTRYDAVRGCYVIMPDNDQNHIQKLGQLEDRDDVRRVEYKTVDGEYEYECGKCGAVARRGDNFCSECGQRLKWTIEMEE